MRKVFSVLVLFAAVSGFLMAQSVTKENCTIEYDSAKKVVRLTNGNAEPYTIQYSIDGKPKSAVLDKNTVWEQDFSKAKAAPKVDIVKPTKGGKVVAPDGKEWKLVPAAAAGKAAPAAGTAAPADGKAAPAPAPAAPAPAPKK